MTGSASGKCIEVLKALLSFRSDEPGGLPGLRGFVEMNLSRWLFGRFLFLETLGFNSGESSKIAEKLQDHSGDKHLATRKSRACNWQSQPMHLIQCRRTCFKSLKKLSKQFGVRFSCHVAGVCRRSAVFTEKAVAKCKPSWKIERGG